MATATRPLPSLAPSPPSVDDWSDEHLAAFLRRLPPTLRAEIGRFASPVVRAALCLRAAQLLSLAPFAERHTLNIVRSFKPGATQVRVYPRLDVSAGRTLPLTLVHRNGSVSDCLWPDTDCDALCERALDVEYGMLVTRRFGRPGRYGTGHEKLYGLMLSSQRRVLARSTGVGKDGRLTLFHEQSRLHRLTGPQWPGALRLIDDERSDPPAQSLPPLRAVEPEDPPHDWVSQCFRPLQRGDYSEAFPERLPGVVVLDSEREMIGSLLEGVVPASGLHPGVARKLERLHGARLRDALAWLVEYFALARRNHAQTTRVRIGDGLPAPVARNLPTTLNLPDDLNDVSAFSTLGRVRTNWLMRGNDGDLAHLFLVLQHVHGPHMLAYGLHEGLWLRAQDRCLVLLNAANTVVARSMRFKKDNESRLWAQLVAAAEAVS